MRFGSLLLTASAGAGKTTRLAEEILKRIKRSDRSIIAISFTRQAKAEMERRILSTVLSGDFSAEEMMFLIMMAGKVHFSTIDSLFHYLLSTESYIPEVADTDEQIKIEELAAELFLQRVSACHNEELIRIASRILRVQPEKLPDELKRAKNVLAEWVCPEETVDKLLGEHKKLKDSLESLQREIEKLKSNTGGNLQRNVVKPLLKSIDELPGTTVLKVKNIDELNSIARRDRESEVYEMIKNLHPLFRYYVAAYILNIQKLRAALLKQLCDTYIQVLDEVKNQWKRVFFEDIAAKLLSLDGKNPSKERPFLMAKLYELGIHSTTDLLIDEFQDTSSSQLELLTPLMEEILSGVNESAEGNRSLLFVGDWKQSIYQWRDARPQQLKEWIEPYIKKGQIREENLPFNWRSTPLLISFFNELSEKLFKSTNIQEPPPLKKRRKPYSGHSEVSVIPVPSIKNNHTPLFEKLVEEVERIKKDHNCAWGDIAVLCRTNNRVNVAKKFLMERGILTTGVRGREVLSIREGVALYLCLIAIFMPDLRFHSYMNGALSGLGYESLIPVVNKLARKYTRMPSPHRLSALSEVLVELEPHFPRPIFECVWNFASAYFERSDTEDAVSFLTEWCRLSSYFTVPEGEHSDRVVVSTMHAVKGLEFPHVVVLWLLDPDRMETFPHPTEGYPLTLTKKELDFLKGNPIEDSEIIARTYENLQETRKAETSNLLYVAVTRAMQSVTVIMMEGEFYDPVEKALLEAISVQIKGACRTQYGWCADYGVKETKDDEEENIPLDFSAFEVEGKVVGVGQPDIVYLSSEIEDRIERGQRFHEALATLKDESGDIDFSALTEEEKETLQHFLERDDVREIIFRKGKVYTEQKISNSTEFGVVDRLIVDNDLITLIDYKTGKRNSNLIEGYRAQMERYRSILSSIFGDCPTEAYLLFLDDDAPVERVW